MSEELKPCGCARSEPDTLMDDDGDIGKCPGGFPGCALADDLIVAEALVFRSTEGRAEKAEAEVERLETT